MEAHTGRANCWKCGADPRWLMRWGDMTRCLRCHTTLGPGNDQADCPDGCFCDDFKPKHVERAWYGCVDCWKRIKPGRATVVVDEVPHTATTTGGI